MICVCLLILQLTDLVSCKSFDLAAIQAKKVDASLCGPMFSNIAQPVALQH